MSPEDFSKRLQQRRALLQLGRILRSPSPRQIADATEVKPQEPKAFASSEVDRAALLFVDLDVKFRQLFPQSLIDRFQQPAIARIRVDQDHDVVREPRVLDGRVPAAARAFSCPLQHLIHLVEVEIAEDG